MIEAFEIVTLEVLDEKFLLRGRAYEDIRIGDFLLTENKLRFRVEKITSYRRETPVLSAMMTGDVLVKGNSGKELSNVKILFKETEIQ